MARNIIARLNALRPRRRHRVHWRSSIDWRARLLGRDVVIARNVTIFRYTEILGPASVGERTFINRDVYVRPQTRIGRDVAIGPFVRLVTDSHELGPAQRRAGTPRTDPIIIGDGVWIGAAALVLGGVTVGAGAVIAAGAVVVDDVPASSLVAGVPARVIRSL